MPDDTVARSRLRQTRYVYRLRDPRDGRVKYVGCSIDPQKRLKQHRTKAHNPAVKEWVRQLRLLGLRPVLEVCGEAGDHWSAPEVEASAIDHAASEYGSFVANIRRPAEQRRLWELRCNERMRRKYANKAYHYVRTQAKRMLAGKLPSCDRRSFRRGYHPPRTIELDGCCLNLAQWAKRCGVSRERIRQRLLKYPPEVAIGAYLTAVTTNNS